MVLPIIDWEALTDAELLDLYERVTQVRNMRIVVPQQMAQVTTDYLNAVGREPGQPWKQPAGGHDAYPRGWQVSHNGKTYESLLPANVWEPGADPNGRFWREVAAEVASDEWTPGLPVTVDQVYTFNGGKYRVVQAHTTQADWTPPAVPALWAATNR